MNVIDMIIPCGVSVRFSSPFSMHLDKYPRLIEREALQNARFLKTRSAYLEVFRAGLDLIQAEIAQPNIRQVDPAQLLLSIIVLCWFPLVHTETFLRPLGIDTSNPTF